jgi:predicted dehydrogenase
MARIAVIGSGRWARVIAQTLCGLPGLDHQLVMFSHSQASALSEWIDAQGLAGRISVASGWPDVDRSDFLAAIVANRAGDHVAAASLTLAAGLPTLVEKPVAIGEGEVRGLVDCAARNATMLAASNVFQFARYVDAFGSLVRSKERIQAITVAWSDPAREIRHGEVKSYDVSLPVVDDVLPHVVPLVLRFGVTDLVPTTVSISRGGQRVEIAMTADRSAACTLVLERNGTARQRSIRVASESGEFALDFAQEPGVIATPQGSIDGDPDWTRELRPLARMLESFVHSASSKVPDPRLSPEHAVKSARVADLVRPLYLQRQVEWLETLPRTDGGDDAAYARRERGV